MIPERSHPQPQPVPWRRAAISSLAAAFAMAACSGQVGTPTGNPAATSVPSVAATASPSVAPPPAVPGGRIAYGRFLGDVGSIFTANSDGTDARQLMPAGAGELPRWSPDGRHLSIVADNDDGLLFVGLVDPDGSHYVKFHSPDPTLSLGCFAWFPDGSRLACEGFDDAHPSRNGIYTVDSTDGGNLIRVTTSPDGAHDIPTDLSPDGRQIVFIRGKPDPGAVTTLMVVNVDGQGARALSEQQLGQGRWSPDGKTILTDAGEDDAKELRLVPIDGGKIKTINIVSDLGLTTAFFASWSPDGQWIVFSGRASESVDLYLVRVDGTQLHQVTNTPGMYEDAADWTAPAP